MDDRSVRVLLVEDNVDHVELIRRAFADYQDIHFELTVADTLSAARALLAESSPDLMLVDYRLPDGEGVELLPGNPEGRRFPIIVFTGHGDQSVAVQALKSGAINYVVKSAATMTDMAGICERAISEWKHIAERRRALSQLSVREAQIKSIFQAAPTGIFMLVKQQIVFANEHLSRMLGYTVDQLNGKSERELFNSEQEFQRWVRLNTEQIGKVGTASVETRFKCMDGSIIDVWLGAAPVDAADPAAGITCTALDITARKKAEEEMRFLASHDSLTRLPNRNLFMDRLSSALAISRRHQNGVAVMFIDLDDFKNVNDEMGHEAGDEVLKQTAARIIACLRESDSIARFGGDEFLVLLPMAMGREAVAGVAAKIIDVMRDAFKVNGSEVRLSCSVGIAMFPEHGKQLEELISEADAAMYAAKKGGKNSWQFAGRS